MILNNFLEHISPQVAKKDAIEEPLLIENLTFWFLTPTYWPGGQSGEHEGVGNQWGLVHQGPHHVGDRAGASGRSVQGSQVLDCGGGGPVQGVQYLHNQPSTYLFCPGFGEL